MKIFIGSDHAGYDRKNEIIEFLKTKEIEVFDMGTYSKESVDYPDFARGVCEGVLKNDDAYGILICFTGIGMSITANKFKNIRASLVGSVEDAILTKEHNNSNVLCLSAKNTNKENTLQIVDAYLKASFTYGRHERRVNKILEIENEKR